MPGVVGRVLGWEREGRSVVMESQNFRGENLAPWPKTKPDPLK